MEEVEFRGEVDVRFVERNEPEGEDLVDFDEEDFRFLVEFCEFLARTGVQGMESCTFAFHFEHNPWRQYLIPSVYHPDHPSRIDFSYEWKGVVREA